LTGADSPNQVPVRHSDHHDQDPVPALGVRHPGGGSDVPAGVCGPHERGGDPAYVDKELNLSASAQGFAGGIFFIGYLLLQIPGAVLAARWSARRTVLILMVTWSFAAMACGLVRTEEQLYVARFLLGVFEGGVWPAC